MKIILKYRINPVLKRKKGKANYWINWIRCFEDKNGKAILFGYGKDV